MKPKDLKAPFSWDDRAPLLKEGVFHVPDFFTHHDTFSLPQWGDERLFGNSNPLCVEYCSGNGLWIYERAKAHPNLNWIAVEKRFDRVRKIWSKARNGNLKNLLVVCGMAEAFTDHYLVGEEISHIYVNFPDPWPKDRHAKHRIIQTPFIDSVARVVKPGGTMTLVTDNTPYSEQMKSVVTDHPAWELEKYTLNPENYGDSYFKALFESKGESIHHMKYIRRIDG